MKKSAKNFVVVYTTDNKILTKVCGINETFIPKDRLFAEFDTKEELDEFIHENGLTDELETED